MIGAAHLSGNLSLQEYNMPEAIKTDNNINELLKMLFLIIGFLVLFTKCMVNNYV